MRNTVLVASVSRKAGGLFDSVRRLSQSLQVNQGIEVTVLSLWDEFTDQDLGEWLPLQPRVFPVIGPRQFGYAPGLGRELKGLGADIVHTHGLWMYPSVAAHHGARRSGIPYVVSTHGMLDPWAVRNSRWKKVVAGWMYEDWHSRGAACLRALCEAEAEAIRAYGLHNPVCIIPNGIDLPGDATPTAAPWVSGGHRAERVLLYLGRFHPKKGLANLLHAWSLVSNSSSAGTGGWGLVLAGWDQGAHRTELETLAQERGLVGVTFLGPQYGTAKEACFAHAAAFVLPSFSEGLPMVVLEAWARGLPVLMTPQCNLPEGFQREAALRIEPEVESIARGLDTLFAMTDGERQTMGYQGRLLAIERFSWPRISGDLKTVYNWLLGGGVPPACVRQSS